MAHSNQRLNVKTVVSVVIVIPSLVSATDCALVKATKNVVSCAKIAESAHARNDCNNPLIVNAPLSIAKAPRNVLQPPLPDTWEPLNSIVTTESGMIGICPFAAPLLTMHVYDGVLSSRSSDTLIVLANQGTGTVWQQGDFTGDGLVNGLDLAFVPAIPEPSVIGLGLVAAISFIGRRKR